MRDVIALENVEPKKKKGTLWKYRPRGGEVWKIVCRGGYYQYLKFFKKIAYKQSLIEA